MKTETLELGLIHETDDAILICDWTLKQIWIPKSQAEIVKSRKPSANAQAFSLPYKKVITVKISAWFAEQKGLI